MIRSFDDAVAACDLYSSLVCRVRKLLDIYKETGVVKIPDYRFLRVTAKQNKLSVELFTLDEHKHYRDSDVYECDLGGPLEVIRTESVYHYSNYVVKYEATIDMPASDVGVENDEMLDSVRAACVRIVKRREEEAAQEVKRLRIAKLKNELSTLEAARSEA